MPQDGIGARSSFDAAAGSSLSSGASLGEAPRILPALLVVEDNVQMNRFLVETLQDDYRVTSAFDGETGLKEALAHPPDIILTDVMMPRMGGDSLLREVRRRPELDRSPVMLLSARADDNLRVALLEMGRGLRFEAVLGRRTQGATSEPVVDATRPPDAPGRGSRVEPTICANSRPRWRSASAISRAPSK